jgi:hypothetical protein
MVSIFGNLFNERNAARMTRMSKTPTKRRFFKDVSVKGNIRPITELKRNINVLPKTKEGCDDS